MSDLSMMFTLLAQAVFLLPTLLICTVGIVMIQKRLPAGKPRKAGVLGLSLLLAGAIANVFFYVLINRFVSSQDYSGQDNMHMITTGYRFFSALLHGGGLIMLVLAICGKDGQADRKLPEENPYGQ